MHTDRLSNLFLATLTLFLPVSAKGVEVLVNGNLESFLNGKPTSWPQYFQGDGPAILESSANVSPFTNIYPLSTRSVLFTDGTTDFQFPQLSQEFSAQTGSVLLSYEFRLSALSGDAWRFVPLTVTNNALDVMRFGGSAGTFTLQDSSGLNTISNLTAGIWYQVSVSFNFPGATYSGSITPFGGSPTTWSNRVLLQSENLGRIAFGDTGTQDSGSLSFDNVSVQAVPEPSTALLLGLASAGFLTKRRVSRCKA